ncbi:MAG: hypothetical protein ACE361_23065 [Aureliella sp.]
MPKTYQENGLNILFPDNWKLDEDKDSQTVTFESPVGAFLTVTRLTEYEPGSAIDQVKAAMREEYDEIEEEAVSIAIGDAEISGYSLKWVYLDLIITSVLVQIEKENGQYLVQYQAEDRDMTQLETVFEAMLHCVVANGPSLSE